MIGVAHNLFFLSWVLCVCIHLGTKGLSEDDALSASDGDIVQTLMELDYETQVSVAISSSTR